MITAGLQLRNLREKLGLTMRDVETGTERLARKYGNEEYFIPISRLSDFETKGVIPSIYRLYSLGVLYRLDFRELLRWYGVDLDLAVTDVETCAPPRSHLSRMLATTEMARIPVRIDPSFDPRKTMNFGRIIEQWGVVPLVYLEQLAKTPYTYGYVGSEDLTMYPLVPPGSFIQVDESRNKVSEGGWRSEYERPIYFIETRDDHVCCWCTLTKEEIILQPHPLSPVLPRICRHHEAEVLGQVVGLAMRLGEWRSVPGPAPIPRGPAALN
jgi:transcriptional regulator with XRE-family HTH domain